jgi:outer membrane protein
MKHISNSRLLISALPVAVAMFALLASGTVAYGQAEQLPTPIMGVVDTDRILQESLAAKGVRLERDKYANQYQSQVKDTEAQLRSEDQNLSQQRSVLAPEVFQQRAQGFQQKLADFQTQLKDKQERLDFAFQQAMQEIGNTIMVVSSEVAKERGINAVMARSQLMIFDPSMDITNSVLEKLNQRLASVAFQNPETLQRQGDDVAAGAAGGQ